MSQQSVSIKTAASAARVCIQRTSAAADPGHARKAALLLATSPGSWAVEALVLPFGSALSLFLTREIGSVASLALRSGFKKKAPGVAG